MEVLKVVCYCRCTPKASVTSAKVSTTDCIELIAGREIILIRINGAINFINSLMPEHE